MARRRCTHTCVHAHTQRARRVHLDARRVRSPCQPRCAMVAAARACKSVWTEPPACMCQCMRTEGQERPRERERQPRRRADESKVEIDVCQLIVPAAPGGTWLAAGAWCEEIDDGKIAGGVPQAGNPLHCAWSKGRGDARARGVGWGCEQEMAPHSHRRERHSEW